jgi:hypothetical protein
MGVAKMPDWILHAVALLALGVCERRGSAAQLADFRTFPPALRSAQYGISRNKGFPDGRAIPLVIFSGGTGGRPW